MLEQSTSILQCDLRTFQSKAIKLGHGSGGKMTSELIAGVFMPRLGNEFLSTLEDATIVDCSGTQIAITTDSYVVKPIAFPGGDIGSLCVHGTVNDLAMRGAKPLYLTAAFILEEGLAVETLEAIVSSMAKASNEAGIKFVAADTKVVNRGAGDQIYITTTGIGTLLTADPPSATKAAPGDVIILSGPIGQHGMAVMCAREGLELESSIESDSAPLHTVVETLVKNEVELHTLRDLTRGGLSSALVEISQSSQVSIRLNEADILVDPSVRATCELLGLDPLYVACEGRFIAIVPEACAKKALEILQKLAVTSSAKVIGQVIDCNADRATPRVTMTSLVGGQRIIDKLSGEQLPRIC